MTNITNDNANNIYGVHINDFTLGAGAGGSLYGIYVQGTEWDYGLYVDDASYFGGAMTLVGNLTITGHLLPAADDQYDLGDNDSRWRDIYLGPGTIHLGTSTADEYAIARELIAARARAGMSQGEVAQRMGTTQSVVARLESGKRPPSMRTVQRFEQAVGGHVVLRIEGA